LTGSRRDLPGVVPRCGLSVLEAVTAVNRLAWRRAEWNFGGLTALGAGSGKELPWSAWSSVVIATATIATAITTAAVAAVATAAITATITTRRTGCAALGLACLPTFRTSLRFGETALRVKVLLATGENEFLSAVTAGQRSICHPIPNLSGRDCLAALF